MPAGTEWLSRSERRRTAAESLARAELALYFATMKPADDESNARAGSGGAPQKEEGSAGLAPPLGDMSAAHLRRYGHQLVDWIGDYFERVERLPVLARA